MYTKIKIKMKNNYIATIYSSTIKNESIKVK